MSLSQSLTEPQLINVISLKSLMPTEVLNGNIFKESLVRMTAPISCGLHVFGLALLPRDNLIFYFHVFYDHWNKM